MNGSFLLSDCLLKKLALGESLRAEGYRGRFAPSPTGSLHLGNVRTALISWLKARLANGRWLLRIDDLDTCRNRPGAIESLQDDLLWLGLKWDGPVFFQSNRRGLYYSFLSELRKQGKVYPCRCSRRRLFSTSKVLDSLHSCQCKYLDPLWGRENGRLPSWKLKSEEVSYYEKRDITLRRSDGFVAYHFATVVDDLLLGINEVVRGYDLKSSLDSQLVIFKLFTFENSIRYFHAPLILNGEGKKLSKRNDSNGIRGLREKSFCPEKVLGLLASSISLVPEGAELSGDELLSELRSSSLKQKILDGI